MQLSALCNSKIHSSPKQRPHIHSFVSAWCESQGGKKPSLVCECGIQKREVASEGTLRTGGWRDVLFGGLFSCWQPADL